MAALLCSALSGCGGTTAGKDGGDGGGGTDGSLGGGSASLAQVQSTIFDKRCGAFGVRSCHTRTPYSNGLDLLAGASYASLVGVQAQANPAKVRVKAGDPDNSFLMQKLTGNLSTNPNEGERMPLGEGANISLSAEEIDLVRRWIAGGAPPQ